MKVTVKNNVVFESGLIELEGEDEFYTMKICVDSNLKQAIKDLDFAIKMTSEPSKCDLVSAIEGKIIKLQKIQNAFENRTILNEEIAR